MEVANNSLVFDNFYNFNHYNNNIIVTNKLEDGELEYRIHNNGVFAKEVTIGTGDGLKFRQLTDTKHFIQLIYDDTNQIVDCEYLIDPEFITSFISKWKSDINELTTFYNASVQNIDNNQSTQNNTVPSSTKWWTNYDKLKNLCELNHKNLKKLIKQRYRRSIASSKHNHRKKDYKQQATSSYLIMPGTNWCGHSSLADKYTSLGQQSKLDSCCRKHDYCPFVIHGFSSKFGMFNRKPFSVSYCGCDHSFRTCLKRVGTSEANLVGKLFFNVVQTKCFVFKPKKTCVKRSWWGKCLKKKYEKHAVLRDNISY